MILFVENWVVVDSFVEMALDGLRLVEEECGVWSPRACRGEPVFARISMAVQCSHEIPKNVHTGG